MNKYLPSLISSEYLRLTEQLKTVLQLHYCTSHCIAQIAVVLMYTQSSSFCPVFSGWL